MKHRLQPSLRLADAEWLAPRLHPFGSGVGSIVPAGFPAYLRILHPARGIDNQPLRWADVAAKSGRTMHRLAQFHAISRPNVPISEGIEPPESGNLPPELLSVLCAVLAQHTNTPDSCRFCLWDGYGWLNDSEGGTVSPALSTAARNASRVQLPYRNYLLFEGPVEAASEFGWTIAGEHFVPQSPSMFWPDDHAWCVASEIDLYCTLVAGSNELAESLIADPRLEVWRVFAGDPVNAGSDEQLA